MAEQNVTEKAGEIISRVKRRTGLEAPAAADDDGRVGIVRGALRAFAEGNMDGFLDAMNEDVTWEAPTGSAFPGAGQFDGRDEVKRRFVDAIGRTYTSFGFSPDSFLDADEENSVMVIGRFVGEGVEQSELDVPAVQLWEFKGNAATRICIFADSHPFPKLVSESDEREREEKERSQEDEDGDEPRGEQRSEGGDQGSDSGEQRDQGFDSGEEAANGGEQAEHSSPGGESAGQPSDGGGDSGRGERSSEEDARSQPSEAS